VNASQALDLYKRVPRVSEIVECLHFGSHGARFKVLQAAHRQTVAEIVFKWAGHVFVAAGGCTRHQSDEWDANFGKTLAITRAAEQLREDMSKWAWAQYVYLERKEATKKALTP